MCSHGLLCLIAKSIVFFEPPVNTGESEKMTVPSESRTFHSVPLRVVRGGRLLQEIVRADWSIFSLPALRTPTAVWNVVLNRKIESGPVSASLTARDDLPQSSQIVAHRLITTQIAAHDLAFLSHKFQATSPARWDSFI